MTSVESRVALLHQILFKMKFIFSVALGYRWTTRTMKVTKSKAKLFLSTRDHQSIPLDLVVAHRRINWPIHRNVNTGRDSISAIKSSSLPLVTSTAVSAFGMFTLVIIQQIFVYLILKNVTIFLLVVLKGRKLLELMDHTQAVRDLAFAPDGSLRLVSASLDRTIKVRSAATFHFFCFFFYLESLIIIE